VELGDRPIIPGGDLSEWAEVFLIPRLKRLLQTPVTERFVPPSD
jgi:hypothetical protein